MTDPAMTREDVLRETEAVLRGVVTSDPYHQQFAPLLDTIDDLRTQLAAAEQARDIATQRENHFHALHNELTAMTEARDLWQSEAGVQQAHRERAEKRITELEEVVRAFQSWHQKTGPDSLPLLTEAVSKLNEFSMPKPSPA